MARLIAVALWLLFTPALVAQDVNLTLTVRDVATERPLPFVSVQLTPGSTGGVAGEDGVVALRVKPGLYTLRASYTGYTPFEQRIDITSDVEATLRLEASSAQLETITVTERQDRRTLTRPTMGVERLTAGEIERLPTVLGESDVLKSLQLLPGISSAGEASNGISVRGGTVDQNLLLFDGAPVFTPTHLFGLFTVFTPDAVGTVDLYRGNIPARFGGRIASVLDVQSKAPATERTEIRGGIGLVSSNLSLDTPLGKAKRAGLLVSARGGFNDFVFPLIKRLKNTRSSFGDATVKLRYRLGENNLFTVTGFYSQDFYQVDLLTRIGNLPALSNQYAYLTLNGGVQYIRLLGESLSLVSEVNRAHYDSELRFPQIGGGRVDFGSSIDYWTGRTTLDLTTDAHRAGLGIQVDRYVIAPGALDPGEVSGIKPVNLPTERAGEYSLYVQEEWKASDRLELSGGLRYTLYRQYGPGEIRNYLPGAELVAATLLEATPVGAGEVAAAYGGLEPRFGLSYRFLERTSFKASYARSRQYLQNIYNATTPLPTSRWKVSDANVGPQSAELFSGGITHRTASERYLFQLEAYHRTIDDLLEYKPGADFFLSPAVETDLLRGEGKGYGVEVSARRYGGRISGEVNYAYSRIENRVQGNSASTEINRGNWYPGYFDQPHTLRANLVVDEGRTHELGFNFVVQSNRPYTVPNGFVTLRNTPVPLFLERNNARLPLYHRLDFSWTISNLRQQQRRWTGKWVFTLYNVYGRDNAYNIFFQPRTANTPRVAIFQGSPFAAYRLSIFGAPIVSLSYKFTFLP